MAINDIIEKKQQRGYNSYLRHFSRRNKDLIALYKKGAIDTDILLLALYEQLPDNLSKEELNSGLLLTNAKKNNKLNNLFDKISENNKTLNTKSAAVLTGLILSKYCPSQGSSHWPPIKFP